MAKDRERKTARILFVEQRKTAKEIHQLLNVSEKTLSGWINADDELWKKERDARNTSPVQRISNMESIISGLADERIQLSRDLVKAEKAGMLESVSEIRRNISKIDDAVSKWNKTLRDINKEAKIPLSTYLEVMQTIFEALQNYNAKLFMQTIDFQEKHIHDISIKLSI
jgi:enoyl reductase-like protein